MRFFEYESRRIVERAGIPVTKYGFCTTPDEAPRSTVRNATAGVVCTPTTTASPPDRRIPSVSADSSSGPEARVSRPTRAANNR